MFINGDEQRSMPGREFWTHLGWVCPQPRSRSGRGSSQHLEASQHNQLTDDTQNDSRSFFKNVSRSLAAHLVSTSSRDCRLLQVVLHQFDPCIPCPKVIQMRKLISILACAPRAFRVGKPLLAVAMIRWSQWCGRWHCWHQYEEGCGAQPATWLLCGHSWMDQTGDELRRLVHWYWTLLDVAKTCGIEFWSILMQILSFVKAQVFVCLFTLQRLPLLYDSVRSKWRNCRRNLRKGQGKS